MTYATDSHPRQEIRREVIAILEELTQDWDAGPIDGARPLGDLGIESVNLVYLIAELQQKYGLQDRLFKQLIADNQDPMALSVQDLVGHIIDLRG